MTRILDRWAERAIVSALQQWKTGRLTVCSPSGTLVVGDAAGPRRR